MNAETTKSAAQAEASNAGIDPLSAKMKAIETRAIERSKRRRAQELLPFPPEAKAEPAIPEQTAQLIEFGVVSRNPRFFRHGYLSGL